MGERESWLKNTSTVWYLSYTKQRSWQTFTSHYSRIIEGKNLTLLRAGAARAKYSWNFSHAISAHSGWIMLCLSGGFS